LRAWSRAWNVIDGASRLHVGRSFAPLFELFTWPWNTTIWLPHTWR